MNPGEILAANGLAAEAGAIVALASALVGAVAGARVRAEARAASLAAENESLRDEVWRLKEAAAARDRAEAPGGPKSRFLATMSHEIRTPINGILGMADLLAQSPLTPENTSYVEAIRSSGSALVALIDQILDLARIESGHFGLALETIEITKLVEGVVELLAPRAQSKGLEIAASVGASAPRFIRADGMRLRQVLTNLAGNAVKFTGSGGVCVSVEASGKTLRFAVIDTGPGVPLERRAAIFEDFEQGDGSPARRFEGAGLGLAISRRLVGLMGGALTLTDNAGGGSMFAFSIPLEEVDALDRAGSSEPKPVALEGTRALIIANSPFEAPAIAARLGEAGAWVARAEGLEAGLAALRTGARLDLVIVDCALGADATNALAHAVREAGAPKSLLLFSPFERRAFGQHSLQGFDGWLVKPVRVRSLFERLAVEFSDRPAFPAAPPNAALRRALLAEDNEVNALIEQKALRRLGFEVVRAGDGEEALKLAADEAGMFDLIVMDIRMPGLDGCETTRRLRLLEAFTGRRRTPIIALTANAADEDRRACLSAGCDALLAKPFEFRDLLRTVEQLCGAAEVGSALPRAS